MKPAPFDYVAPATLDDADRRPRAPRATSAKVLAGGQSLIPMLALRLARPAVLVDINRLRGLDGIREAARHPRGRRPRAPARARALGGRTARRSSPGAPGWWRTRRSATAARWWATSSTRDPGLGAARGAALPRGRGGRARARGRAHDPGRPVLSRSAHHRARRPRSWPPRRASRCRRRARAGASRRSRAATAISPWWARWRCVARGADGRGGAGAAGLLRRRRDARAGRGRGAGAGRAARRRRRASSRPRARRPRELSPDGDIHATASYRRRVAATLAERTLTAALARCGGRAS